MKNIVTAGEAYIKKMNILDMGLLKICVFSLGLFSGVCVSRKNRKRVGFWALVVYILTYIPLMSKFFGLYNEKE